jgi:hypothetical protein
MHQPCSTGLPATHSLANTWSPTPALGHGPSNFTGYGLLGRELPSAPKLSRVLAPYPTSGAPSCGILPLTLPLGSSSLARASADNAYSMGHAAQDCTFSARRLTSPMLRKWLSAARGLPIASRRPGPELAAHPRRMAPADRVFTRTPQRRASCLAWCRPFSLASPHQSGISRGSSMKGIDAAAPLSSSDALPPEALHESGTGKHHCKQASGRGRAAGYQRCGGQAHRAHGDLHSCLHVTTNGVDRDRQSSRDVRPRALFALDRHPGV